MSKVQHGFNTFILLFDAKKMFLKTNTPVLVFFPYKAKNWNLAEQRWRQFFTFASFKFYW